MILFNIFFQNFSKKNNSFQKNSKSLKSVFFIVFRKEKGTSRNLQSVAHDFDDRPPQSCPPHLDPKEYLRRILARAAMLVRRQMLFSPDTNCNSFCFWPSIVSDNCCRAAGSNA